MSLLEILDKNLIKVPLTSATADGVIEELISLYADEHQIGESRKSELIKAVKDREALGSTAMPCGIAIPHAKVDSIEKSAVMIGISRIPVDFGSPARIFFLVLVRSDNPSEHIQLLSSIARISSSQIFLRMLSSARSADEVYQLFFE